MASPGIADLGDGLNSFEKGTLRAANPGKKIQADLILSLMFLLIKPSLSKGMSLDLFSIRIVVHRADWKSFCS